MNSSTDKRDVLVELRTFTELFADASHDLALDSYQRPYVWSSEKVDQLVEDLREHEKQADLSIGYYMGVILLHANKEEQRLFVIDGQQRLTVLCVLHHVIKSRLPDHCDLTYRNPASLRNIKQAQEHLAPARDLADMLDRICFTVITVESEDLAFTFFDTQNNRGVPLNATDLLKAFHLREIAGEHDLQRECAKGWEQLQNSAPLDGQQADFAPTLFHQLLWRARRWTGQRLESQHPRESHDELITEFQTRSIRSGIPDTVPLYATASTRLGTLTLIPDEGYHLTAAPIRPVGQAADLPFIIRQPISRGVGFFLYSDKYADLYQQVLPSESPHPHPQMRAFHNFYQEVLVNISPYLRELFVLATAMYLDQFGPDNLLKFALWLDHALGAIRIEKQYIFAAAPIIFLRDGQMNLLDVIAGAFRSDEVIDYLRVQTRAQADAVYKAKTIDKEGVQLRYKRAVLRYYGQMEAGDLSGKANWITDTFVAAKVDEA